MPALTPRMTCRGIAVSPGTGSGGRFLWLDGLRGQQPLADLAQRDRQRLLLDAGLDERPGGLQQPPAQLSVVGVDLPCPLGGPDDQAVLADDHAEEGINRRVGYDV